MGAPAGVLADPAVTGQPGRSGGAAASGLADGAAAQVASAHSAASAGTAAGANGGASAGPGEAPSPVAAAVPAPGEGPGVAGPDGVPAAEAPDHAATEGDAGEALPLPPVSPRLGEGRDYEHCMDMMASDPSGALAFAEAWVATGGGDSAQHCQALAQVELGDPGVGAELLDRVAQTSAAPALSRAAVFGQADQAWMMAGDAGRAYASATLALTLSPDDPDLLIDRAVAAATLGRFREVTDDLDRALELEPRRVDALVYRAAAQRHLEHLDLASDDLARAFSLDPDDPDALLERGIDRQRAGDLTGARADWERATALAPDTPTGDLAQQDLSLLEAGPPR